MTTKRVKKLRHILTQMESVTKFVTKKELNLNFEEFCLLHKFQNALLHFVKKAEHDHRKMKLPFDDSELFG